MNPVISRQIQLAIFLALPIVTAASLGCNAKPPLEEKVLRCAQLQGAKQSKLVELASEVKRVEDAGEGPQQLTQPIPLSKQNAAAVLAQALNDADRLRLYPELEALAVPAGTLVSPEELVAIRTLLAKEADLTEAVRRAGELPKCESGVRFDLGFFERYALLDDAAIAARLHLIGAYAAQADKDRQRLLAETERAARWIQWLAAEPRIEGRLLAARLRLEWFELLRSIAGRSVTSEELSSLYAMLRTQLNDWPPDRKPLVGDRALTMHSYEALRIGMLDRVVTIDEKRMLEEAGWLEKLRSLDAASLDQDQLVYLQAMAQVIRSSVKPYYRRSEELSDLFSQFQEDGELAQQAPAATQLFFAGIAESLEKMARDRALAEAWMLALASAADFDLPPYRTNPLNGLPYEAERRPDGVRLKLGDFESPDPFVRTPEGV